MAYRSPLPSICSQPADRKLLALVIRVRQLQLRRVAMAPLLGTAHCPRLICALGHRLVQAGGWEADVSLSILEPAAGAEGCARRFYCRCLLFKTATAKPRRETKCYSLQITLEFNLDR